MLKSKILISKCSISQTELNDPATAVIFFELYEKIEHFCELAYFGFIKVTAPIFILPALFATIFNYFVLNLSDESFILAAPISYVSQMHCYRKERKIKLIVECHDDFFKVTI